MGLGKIHMPLPEKDAHTGTICTLQDYVYKAITKRSKWEICEPLWKTPSVGNACTKIMIYIWKRHS